MNVELFTWEEVVNVAKIDDYTLTSCATLMSIVYTPKYANLVFFQNEEIFVELDEIDELDRITHA